jgi:cell division protein FtsQ
MMRDLPQRAHAVSFEPVKAATVRRSSREVGRPAIRAVVGTALRLLAAAAISGGLSACAWQGWQWATRSPAFALREIRVRGNLHASEEELLRRSGLTLGANLFHADLATAARAVEAHPWVKSARLSRRPPGAVVIEVVEHVPVASVQLGSLYLLDGQGELFKKAAPGDFVDLPLVTGLFREDWQGRRQDAQLRILSALQLLDAWRGEGLSLSRLSEVRLDDDGGVTVFAREEGGPAAAQGGVQEIRLGTRAFAERLRRLGQVRAALERRGERATRIDLDNETRPEWVAAQLDKTSAATRRPPGPQP